jgi:nucleoid-associated protein YgaU
VAPGQEEQNELGYAGGSIQEVLMSDMPDFSNVNSGSSSTAEKIYEVKSGDSLSKIAKNEYGDANKWHQIFEANQDILKDPNKIFPGQKLRIPPLS